MWSRIHYNSVGHGLLISWWKRWCVTNAWCRDCLIPWHGLLDLLNHYRSLAYCNPANAFSSFSFSPFLPNYFSISFQIYFEIYRYNAFIEPFKVYVYVYCSLQYTYIISLLFPFITFYSSSHFAFSRYQCT